MGLRYRWSYYIFLVLCLTQNSVYATVDLEKVRSAIKAMKSIPVDPSQSIQQINLEMIKATESSNGSMCSFCYVLPDIYANQCVEIRSLLRVTKSKLSSSGNEDEALIELEAIWRKYKKGCFISYLMSWYNNEKKSEIKEILAIYFISHGLVHETKEDFNSFIGLLEDPNIDLYEFRMDRSWYSSIEYPLGDLSLFMKYLVDELGYTKEDTLSLMTGEAKFIYAPFTIASAIHLIHEFFISSSEDFRKEHYPNTPAIPHVFSFE